MDTFSHKVPLLVLAILLLGRSLAQENLKCYFCARDECQAGLGKEKTCDNPAVRPADKPGNVSVCTQWISTKSSSVKPGNIAMRACLDLPSPLEKMTCGLVDFFGKDIFDICNCSGEKCNGELPACSIRDFGEGPKMVGCK